MLAALAAATVAFVAFPGLSGAVATVPPDVTATGATDVTATGATINGTVTLNDPDTDGSYTFSWGTSPGVFSLGSSTGPVSAGASNASVQATLSSLTPATTYYYQLCATNTFDQACDQQSFTTLALAPTVSSATAGSITPTSATLSGTVNPGGASTTYAFNWGTSQTSLPNSSGGTLSAGTSDQPVQKTITLPSPATTYWYELCATNTAGGPNCTTPQSFAAPDKPGVTTGAASAVTAHGATLSGTVTPNGAAVDQAYFEYGTTSSYGATWNASLNGNSAQATLNALASGTTFHYALCAHNTWGTRCDSVDHTFKTDTPPTAVLTADKTSGPTPLAVMFDGSTSSDPDQGDSVVSYTFTFGDGSSVTQSTPTITHTYTSPCSPCTASLTVTDEEGAQSTAASLTIHATANQPPVASLSAAPTEGTVPLDVSFDGSASTDPDGIVLKSWSLDFGDQSTPATGKGAVPSAIPHTYTAAGTYQAVLTVKDSSNASTSSTPLTITVDPLPSISIGDVSQNEGNSGTTSFVFPVTMSAKSTHDVSVDYATADGTATAGSDYTATTGTLTIPAGTDCTTSNPACQITVPVNGDTLYEANETFTLDLANPAGATIADGSATGTILNDDQQPVLMIEDNAVLEGNAGSQVDGAQQWPVNGSLKLVDASGFPNTFGDSFTVTDPGTRSVSTYTYQSVSGNTLVGVSPAGSVIADEIASQPRPIQLTVYLCDPTKMSSPTDTNVGDCTSRAETASGLDTTVQYSTSNGRSGSTGIPVLVGQDYVYSTGTLTIPAGAKSGQITVQEIPNTTLENPADPSKDLDRWFDVNLGTATNATVPSGLRVGFAHILEDDGLNPPSATTGGASSIGADHATVSATVNPEGAATDVFVQYGTTDLYGSQTATQSLAAGSTPQTLSFSLTGLSPGTTYHVQVVARHADGSTGYGQDATFTTDKLPIAVLKANKTSGAQPPFTVTFDGSASSDPDGSIASWKLAFGDGSSTSGAGAVPSAIVHTYAGGCKCTASLTVTDNQGAESAPATRNITVGSVKIGPPPKLSTVDTTVGPLSATIVFPVDPNGADTKVWIAYGKTVHYDHMTPAQLVPAGATLPLTFVLRGLSPQTRYHYRLFAAHTTDSGAAQSQDLPFTTKAEKPMRFAIKTKTLKVSKNGTLSLPISCSGNVLTRCTGRAVLKLGNKIVAAKSFSMLPGQHKPVRLKLKPAILRQLLARQRLRLKLTLSVRTGLALTGSGSSTTPITILAPRK